MQLIMSNMPDHGFSGLLACFAQCFGVGCGSLQICCPHPLVKLQGGVELVHDGVDIASEASTPQFLGRWRIGRALQPRTKAKCISGTHSRKYCNNDVLKILHQGPVSGFKAKWAYLVCGAHIGCLT